MITFTYQNRRIVQHTDTHYDIEESRTDEDGNCVWAVIECSEGEKDFAPCTMTRATQEDIERMYRQLLGEAPLRKEDEMARTLKGNLTGKAARLDRSDLADYPQPSPFTVAFYDAVDCLRDAMGEDEFDAWYDQPEFSDFTNAEMLTIMRGKIASLVNPLDSWADEPFTDAFCDERLDPRTPEQKSADAFQAEYSNDETIRDIRTGFQQW